MLNLIKWIGIFSVALIALVVVVSKDGPIQTGHEATTSQQKEIVDLLMKTEPKVKDAYWSTSSTLLIGVLDDRTQRDGLASYFCEVVRQKGITDNLLEIRIIDIVKVKNNNERITLGKKFCNK